MKKIIRIDTREPKEILDLFTSITNGREDFIDFEIAVEALPVADVEYLEMEDSGLMLKRILVERKTLEDLMASIEDARTVTQYESMLDANREDPLLRMFTIIVGTDWDRIVMKHNYYKTRQRGLNSYYDAMINVIAKYARAGLNVLPAPGTEWFVKLCFDLFDGDVEDVVKHVITVDYSNRKHEDFARSIECLVKGLGIKTAEIIARHYSSYAEIIDTDPLSVSNVVRMDKNQKIGKKPIPTIETLWNKCKGIENDA